MKVIHGETKVSFMISRKIGKCPQHIWHTYDSPLYQYQVFFMGIQHHIISYVFISEDNAFLFSVIIKYQEEGLLKGITMAKPTIGIMKTKNCSEIREREDVHGLKWHLRLQSL